MNDLASICLRCRTRIRASPSSHNSQSARQAVAYYSNAPQQPPFSHFNDVLPQQSADRATRIYPRPRRSPVAKNTFGKGPSSIEIFMNVVKEQGKNLGKDQEKEEKNEQVEDAAIASPPDTAAAGTAANWTMLQDIATLQSMLRNKDDSLAACFVFFEHRLYPALRTPEANPPKALRERVAKTLIQRAWKAKANDFEANELPTVTHISQLALEMGWMEPQNWAILTLKLMDHLCTMNKSPRSYTSIDSYETAMAQREALLDDLVGAWKVLNLQRFTALRVRNAAVAAEQVGVPSFGDAIKIQLSSKNLARNPLGMLFPHYNAQRLEAVTTAALATYALMTDTAHSKQSARRDLAPFLKSIAHILKIVRPTHGQLEDMLKNYPSLAQYVLSRWPTVEAEVSDVSRAPTIHDRPLEGARIHRLVGQAWKAKDARAVEAAFVEFYGEGVEDPDRKRELVRNAELFNYFIMAFMGLRQPKLAMQTWKAMSAVGIEPSLKTWTAMMDGCVRARDLESFRAVWARLVQSKTTLDTAVWTARISGLIKLGETSEGLGALIDMAKMWKNREDPATEFLAVQPSIEPVNAAVVGLLRLDKVDNAKAVLAWAAEQGIQPNIFTYNTLLGALVNQGLNDEVRQLLGVMKAQDVAADVVTFTIMMQSVLTGLGQLEPQAQAHIVSGLLADMEAVGAKANMMAYAKMIHILLAEGDSAAESVRTVMGHIWSNGLELTSHIYTMLADYYFARTPPDVAAVTALIENRDLYNNKDIDRVFWECVITGYCKTGHPHRALAIFDKLKVNNVDHGITLATRYELLHALLGLGHTEAAAELVHESTKLKASSEDGGPGRFWRHRFWHLAKREGLLRLELLPIAAKGAGLDV